MKIKVTYNATTGFVTGYYPDNILYTNIAKPFLEIKEEEWKKSLGKTMMIKNNTFQEFVQTNEFLLEQAKQNKKQELDLYYHSADSTCWTIKIISEILNASITKNQDWFKGVLTYLFDATFPLFTDNGERAEYYLTTEIGRKLAYRIIVTFGLEMKMKYQEIITLINDQQTIETVNDINVQTPFSTIDRTIILESF
jgi:hypothetical protein